MLNPGNPQLLLNTVRPQVMHPQKNELELSTRHARAPVWSEKLTKTPKKDRSRRLETFQQLLVLIYRNSQDAVLPSTLP